MAFAPNRSSVSKSTLLQDVRYIVAIAAGKGGVGKSSVAVNLSFTLQKMGYQVGILDADLYGPSLGVMMPLDEPCFLQDDKIIPGSCRGVKVFSLAHTSPEGKPIVARAPVVNGLITECAEKIAWGPLDYLFVDFPPGTGDIQLTLLQTFSFSGAILVTTPQEVSVVDVQKTAEMFDFMNVWLLGAIENMSYFEDPQTKNKHFVFGIGGGDKVADAWGIPLLGKIPLDQNIAASADLGRPFPFLYEQTTSCTILEQIAVSLRDTLFHIENTEKTCIRNLDYEWK